MGDLRDWSETMELHLRSVKAELEHSGVRLCSGGGFHRRVAFFVCFSVLRFGLLYSALSMRMWGRGGGVQWIAYGRPHT